MFLLQWDFPFWIVACSPQKAPFLEAPAAPIFFIRAVSFVSSFPFSASHQFVNVLLIFNFGSLHKPFCIFSDSCHFCHISSWIMLFLSLVLLFHWFFFHSSKLFSAQTEFPLTFSLLVYFQPGNINSRSPRTANLVWRTSHYSIGERIVKCLWGKETYPGRHCCGFNSASSTGKFLKGIVILSL